VKRHRENADPQGIGFAHDHQRGAGVDHEVDRAAGNPGLDLEMTLAVGIQRQAAAG
jgi:hypothetical protein